MGLLDDKIDLIEKAEIALAGSLDKVDKQLASEIIKIYVKFVQGNELVLNAQQLAQLEDSLIAAVAKTDYKLAVNGYVKNFDAIDQINAKLHQSVNKIDVNAVIAENVKIKNHRSVIESQMRGTPSTLIRTIDEQTGREITTAIRNESLNELINPIAEVIRKDIILGHTFESATEAILEQITKKELGLERWAGQIAKDALNQSDGIVNDEIRKQFKMKYVVYQGTIKNTSRPVCRHFINNGPGWKYEDLQKELNKFAPGGVPIKGSGDGMIPGTTAENFLTRRGGYNCRHIITPSVLPPVGYKEEVSVQPDEFVPAKSILEAEKLALSNGLYVADYKGLELETANSINKSIIESQNKYEFKNPLRIMNHNMAERDKGLALALSDKQSIRYDFDEFKNFKNLNTDLLTKFNEGELAASNIKEVIDHEMGHQLTQWDLASKKGIYNDAKNIYDEYINGRNDILKKFYESDGITPKGMPLNALNAIEAELKKYSLSEYSTVNLDEFIAEGYTLHINNKKQDNVYVRLVGELIDKNYKK